MRRRALSFVAIGTAFSLFVPAGIAMAATPRDGGDETAGWKGATYDIDGGTRRGTPEDRYAMAGGCYALAAGGSKITRVGDGFGAAATGAEPFFFKATDLGRYMVYGTQKDFLAGSEGVLGQAAEAFTGSHPGGVVGGLTLETTDAVAETITRSEANGASGRGAEVVAANAPSDLADWIVKEDATGFTLSLDIFGNKDPDRTLALTGDTLSLAPAGQGTSFEISLAKGCTAYPEIEPGVVGPVQGGETSHQEVRGYYDGHLHMMAFEFLGGRARCGRPWHRFGAPYALVDCPDHEPGGFGAVLEKVVSGHDPTAGHNTDGWPTFEGWPHHDSLTHEQVYYKWLERAWRGGLRMFTNLLVDNNQLCKIYPYRRNSCNEMEGVYLQAKRIRELQDYIDAQSGGPGEGWFRIVKDPFEAREVINSGKLAVVLGIEVSVPLDCGITLGQPRCNKADIDRELGEVWKLGVRQMEITNKFDNALTGVTGDSGTTGYVVNVGNAGETGQFWQMETCTEGEPHDHTQMNIHDNAPDYPGRDELVGVILTALGRSGAVPVYPEGPHCNVQALSSLGKHMIRGMVKRGIIFDPDHMSARARTQAMDLIEKLGYPGLISSHGWADDTIYPRILALGGVVTPHAKDSFSWKAKYDQHKAWQDDRFVFGLGFGSDMNGFSSQGGPPPADDPAPTPVTYPFAGLGGVTVKKQISGEKTYDYGVDGVAHYGMYIDYIEHVRKRWGQAVVDDMAMSAEQYLQMWERAWGIAGDACRVDIPDLPAKSLDRLRIGMDPKDVMKVLGQPRARAGADYTFCVDGARTATVTFDAGRVASWVVS